MIILHDEEVLNITDDRVKVVPKFDFSDSNGQNRYYDVYIDDALYMSSIALYMEHKQYQIFEASLSEFNIQELFGKYNNIVFIDIGTKEPVSSSSSNTEEYRDYSAKGREGISYFDDIIINEDKECLFKRNYMKVGVRL